eukprot:gene10191-biopygen9313
MFGPRARSVMLTRDWGRDAARGWDSVVVAELRGGLVVTGGAAQPPDRHCTTVGGVGQGARAARRRGAATAWSRSCAAGA